MSFALFAQILFNIIVLAGLFAIFARLRRPAKDDPRLSKGLQLLSNKIAVLEDLSDRTEQQVNQMLQLLDQKSKELQSKVYLAEQHVKEVQVAMSKSLEVSKIFQDKIPHNEIIERQQSMKYIRAARLAYQGKSVDEIAREIDLPRGEIEFIAKVNREALTFREEELPEWAREPQVATATPEEFKIPHAYTPQPDPEQQHLIEQLSRLQSEMQSLDFELSSRTPQTSNTASHASAHTVAPSVAPAAAIAAPQRATNTQVAPQANAESKLEMLGEEFRKAIPAATGDLEAARAAARDARLQVPKASAEPVIRKVQFPRIESLNRP